jgi:hypothetical protein
MNSGRELWPTTMNSTFRLRKTFLYLGIIGTLCFFVATFGSAIPFFLKQPAKHGFKGPHSVAIVAGSGVVFFALLTALSIYMIIEYYVSNVSIVGTMIRIQSVFRIKQFDASSINCLEWKHRVPGGKLVLRTTTNRAVLSLKDFADVDGLAIIRQIRRLIPENIQLGWEEFCHFVALPLREGRRPRHPGSPPSTDLMSLPETDRVFVTRQRYDRLFAVVLPLIVIAATVVWWQFAMVMAFALLPIVVFFWGLLRFNVPKQGKWSTKWAATPEGRIIGLSQLALPAIFLLMMMFRLAGLNQDVALYLGAGLLGLFCVRAIRQANSRQRDQCVRDAHELPSSVGRWNALEKASVAAALST